MTELAKYTTGLFEGLEEETGQATGFKQNGSISLALNDGRFEELKRGASMAKSFGLEVEVIGPAEIKARFPHSSSATRSAACSCPRTARSTRSTSPRRFAKGARKRGAKIFENTKVKRILVEQGRAVGVRPSEGRSPPRPSCSPPACGRASWRRRRRQHAPACGRAFLHRHRAHRRGAAQHAGGAGPDECTYYKEDAGKLLVGAFEPVAKPWGIDGIPEAFCFDTLPEDMDHFEPILESATRRVPMLENAGIQIFFNGPESFTPDDRYYLGEAPEVRDLFVATGFNSIGIQTSGGAGLVLSQWIRERPSPWTSTTSISAASIRSRAIVTYVRDRTAESLGLLYAMHWPYRQVETARGVRRSPIHDRLVAAGAGMGEVNGWERPNWYAPPGVEPEYEYSYGRQNWFGTRPPNAGRCATPWPCSTSRASPSSWSREDACEVLNRLSASRRRCRRPAASSTPSGATSAGGIEADLTVTRLAEILPGGDRCCGPDPRFRLARDATSRTTPTAASPTSPPACRCSP